MGNAERAVEDAVIAYLKANINTSTTPIGRYQSLSEIRSASKIYVAAQPFEDFNYRTETPTGKIPLQIVVSSFIPDDPDRDALDTAIDAFEEAWAGAIHSNITDVDVYVVDGIVIGKGSSGFNDQGYQQKIYEYELYGHKAQ